MSDAIFTSAFASRAIHSAIGAHEHGVRRPDIGTRISGKAACGNGFVADFIAPEHLGSGRGRGKRKRASEHERPQNVACARNNGSARRCERFESCVDELKPNQT